MKCFVAQLTDGKHINVVADRMDLQDDTIRAYDGDALVAIVDKGATLSAHISEKVDVIISHYEGTHTFPAKEQEAPQNIQPIPTPKPPQGQRPEPAETGYKGFLYIKCSHCGAAKGYFPKTPIREHRCDCGNLTELRDLKPLYVNCKCGASFKYRTNLTSHMASMTCIQCKAPVDLELNTKKDTYTTIGGCAGEGE